MLGNTKWCNEPQHFVYTITAEPFPSHTYQRLQNSLEGPSTLYGNTDNNHKTVTHIWGENKHHDKARQKPSKTTPHFYMDGRVQILVDAHFKFLHILGPDWILNWYYRNEIVSTHIPLTKTLSRSNLHFKLWQSNTLLQNMSLVLK